MGLSIRVVLIAGALFVLAAYVLAGFFVYKNDAELVASRDWVIHTYKVMMQLREVLSAVKDCETGERGFLITGNPSYLQPYEKGLSRIDQVIDQLEILLADNKPQQGEFKRLKPIIALKLSELKKCIKARQETGFDAARAIVESNVGRATMDDIRESIERMKSTEESHLVSRLNHLSKESDRARAYSVCLIIASYILSGIMLALIGRLLARVERDRVRLTLQYQIARILADPQPLHESMITILETICTWLHWDFAAFWSWDKYTDELRCAYSWHLPTISLPEFQAVSSKTRMPKGVDFLGRAWEKGEPIWIVDARAEKKFQRAEEASKAGLRGALAMPIFLGGQFLGIVELYSRQARRSDRTMIESLITVSSNIAHFIEHKLKAEESLRKEQQLRESERRFRAIFDQTFQFIGILSPQGVLLEGNRSALDFEGVKLTDVIGQYFWDTPWWTHSAESQEKLKRAIEQAARGKFVRFETEHIGKTGRITVDFSIKPVFDDSGRVVMLIPEGRDISERIRAESALAEREARTRAILDTAAEGIITIANPHTGIIESANNAAHKIFGFGPGELIGFKVTDVVPNFLALVEFAATTVETPSGDHSPASPGVEATANRADGSLLPVEIALSFCKVADQEVITGIVRDITERKEVERRVREFYSMISHELRTPLTSIRGSLSLMAGGRTGELPPRAMHLVKVAHSESERLIRLINDILDTRKIEAGKLELMKVSVEVPELVADSLESIRSTADSAKVKLVGNVNTSGRLHCDRDRITQVIANLLSNAIKYSPANGKVVLTAEKTARNYYRFAITDEGPGISAEQKPKLFGIFQQLDLSDSRPKGGTGLGLAISKGIVEQHGGTIGVDSVIGEGSTFWFELPDITAPEPWEKTTTPFSSTHKALLVDDDEKLCQVLAVMLEEQGFTVVRAGSVKEAENCLEADGNPDVIILDIWLPDGNGLELMNKLGQNDKTGKIPIIILSGKEPDHNYYVNPVLVDWIQKPFQEKRLVSALRTAVRQRLSGKARILIVEDHQPTRDLIKQELETIDVECIEAADGITAVLMARTKDPDLIVLDLAMPGLDGFEVVNVLQKEKCQHTPLVVYTARDLTDEDKRNLTLGLTTHLIKSRTSEGELLEAVKSMLNGLVKHPLTTGSPPETQ